MNPYRRSSHELFNLGVYHLEFSSCEGRSRKNFNTDCWRGVTTLKFFWAEDEKARAIKSISPINQYGNLVPMPFSTALW